ncbi:histidine phosphatase superfamily [Spinellus fusiger]|nr:histidine phosphatase superfamily [Spinellus fusiger]
MTPTPTSAFIVRHGERIDHVDKLWQPDPRDGIWNPPLSANGHEQARKTGIHLIQMMQQNNLCPEKATIVLYTSPFQRCVDTAIGIAKGMSETNDCRPPVLCLELGLGEWMSDHFFDTVCPAQAMMARQQESLARRQAYTYTAAARPTAHIDYTKALPPLTIDYSYSSSRTEFDFPEDYTDMLDRFNDTRKRCLERGCLPKTTASTSSGLVVPVFITHAVGVNALLDSFRNRMTRPIEVGYCALTLLHSNTMAPPLDSSDQSDADQDEFESEIGMPVLSAAFKHRWTVSSGVSNHHLEQML